MTFLAPIPALIAAAITIPALLTLYFLKLRRRPVRVSSTLLWDQAIRDLQVNVPFRLIRPTWLLLLQFLILTLFLLALARPAIDLPQGSPGRVLFLIDRSASMSARDAGTESAPRSRIDAAKTRALERLDQLARSGSTFGVISFAAEPILLSPFSDAAAARTAITAIEPTDQPGNLRSALALAGSLFSGDTDESSPRPRGLAVLFSDGAFRDANGLTLSGGEFRFECIGPARASDPDAPSAAASHDNLGIVALAARREWDDPAAIRIFARLINASDHAATVPITLSLDGREVDSAVVTIPAATAAAAASTSPTADEPFPETTSLPAQTIAPGQAAASFKLESRDGGVATVRIGREDALASDNSASLVLAPASKPRILVVIPDRIAGQERTPEWILTNVIEELRLPMRLMSASLYAQEAASRRADLIIFDSVTPAAMPAIPTLSFGAGLPGIPLGRESTRGTYFLSWNRSHPVLRNASLDGVYVSKPLPLTSVAPDDELARGTDGPLIALAPAPGPRRILVAFELANSNWPIQVGFPIFLASAIDYLTLRAEDRAGGAFTTGEPASLELGASGTVTLDGPKTLTLRNVGAGPTNIGLVERAGIYRVNPASEGKPIALAINLLDETESSLAVRDTLQVSGQLVSAATGDSGPREIWPWLVLAALVLLSIEWLVNAWSMRV